MIRFVKANRKVAEFLHLDKIRIKYPDGNYCLHTPDMRRIDPLYLGRKEQVLADIGGIELTDEESAAEYRGQTEPRKLPIPLNPIFIDPEAIEEEAIEDGATIEEAEAIAEEVEEIVEDIKEEEE